MLSTAELPINHGLAWNVFQAVLDSVRSATSMTTTSALSGKRPAFIGIVIAITANIIISLALNVQKMAHIRLQQEQEHEQHQYSSDDEDDDYQDDEDEERAEGDDLRTTGGRMGLGVDTIQEETESTSTSARSSQHLTPSQAGGLGPLTTSKSPTSASSAANSPPPSPSPAPRALRSSASPRVGSREGSGSTTEVDSSASPPSSQRGKGKLADIEAAQQIGDEDEQDGHEEQGDSEPSRPQGSSGQSNGNGGGGGPNTKFLRSRLWWAGIGLMTLGEAGNFISYGFAPASLVAPLGAVALLSNVIIAPILLKERFRPRDLTGIALAIVGAVTVVFSSRQDDPQLGPDALWESIRRSVFLIYMGVVLSLGAVLAALSLTRLGDRFVLLDVGTCAIFGGFTVLSTKGISSMLSAGPSPFALFRYPITYALAFVLASTAVAQITFLNRALQRFDSRQVIPTMFTLFTIMAIVGSAVLYRDFEDMDAHRLINFLFGCGTTFAGVFLLTRRHDEEEGARHHEHHGGEYDAGAEGVGVDGRRGKRNVLEDVMEEDGTQTDDVDEAHTGVIKIVPGVLVADPERLSLEPSTPELRHSTSTSALPTHSHAAPTHADRGIPIALSNAAGRRARTALDGTGTAFLAAGSPPGMAFALGGTSVQPSPLRPSDSFPAYGSSPSREGSGGPGAAPVVSSTAVVPVVPVQATGGPGSSAVSGVAGTTTGGGGLLPLYRTPRMSLVGSSGGLVPSAAVVTPTPSASISAFSAGQLLLLATPTPMALPVAIPSRGGGREGGDGIVSRSYSGETGGLRSRTLSQPNTPVPRRRSRRALRADAEAQAQHPQHASVGRSGSLSDRQRTESAVSGRGGVGTSDGRGREDYARGQGSWTERRRPSSGIGLPSGSSVQGVGASNVVGSGRTLPQRRSVISLFGGFGGGSWTGTTGGPQAPSPAPASSSGTGTALSPPVAATATMAGPAAGPGAPAYPRPPSLRRGESAPSAPTSPPTDRTTPRSGDQVPDQDIDTSNADRSS
ncbi:hypothetical protein V8E36_008624 [Tilletia maclaganii]